MFHKEFSPKGEAEQGRYLHQSEPKGSCGGPWSEIGCESVSGVKRESTQWEQLGTGCQSPRRVIWMTTQYREEAYNMESQS